MNTETELEEPEIEAVLPPIYQKEEKPAIIKEIKPIVKQKKEFHKYYRLQLLQARGNLFEHRLISLPKYL